MYMTVPYYSKLFANSVNGMAEDIGNNIWSYRRCFNPEMQQAFNRHYGLILDLVIQVETFTVSWKGDNLLVNDGEFLVVCKDLTILKEGVIGVSTVDRDQADELIKASDRYKIMGE